MFRFNLFESSQNGNLSWSSQARRWRGDLDSAREAQITLLVASVAAYTY